MIGRQTARLVHCLTWIYMKSLGVIFHGLLIKGSSRRIHALVARLHRDLIGAILVLLLLLIVEETTLHGMAVVDDCLDRVILLISVDERIDLIFICLILYYLALIITFTKISCSLSLLARLFKSTNDLLLLIVCV